MQLQLHATVAVSNEQLQYKKNTKQKKKEKRKKREEREKAHIAQQ